MSTAPGWYPDPSGQAAQRYHDGTNWTEHVSDAAGNRSTAPLQQAPVGGPPPAGVGGPPPAAPYGGAPAAAPFGAAASSGFTPTVGFIAAAVGAVLVLLSVFALDFLTAEGDGADLGEISDVGDFVDLPFALDSYTSFGRILGFLVALAIVAVATGMIKQVADVPNLPIIVAAVGGVFGLWHLLAMFSSIEGADVSPAFGAFLGLLGYIGLAASPFLKQPVGSKA
jgi:hypothetical protein